MRLGPYLPKLVPRCCRQRIFRFQRNYNKAITAFEGRRNRLPNDVTCRTFPWLRYRTRKPVTKEGARAAAKELLARKPKFSIESVREAVRTLQESRGSRENPRWSAQGGTSRIAE